MGTFRLLPAIGAVIALALASSLNNKVTAQTSASGFQDAVVFTGLESPTAVRFSPDGRVFVAEKSGLIKVFDSLSDTTPTVFADLRTNVHNSWDRGLLGLALDPGFPTNPYVYVLYTYDGPIGGPAPRWGTPGATDDPCPDATTKGCVVSGRLSRLQAAGNQMTGAEQVLVQGWFQQFPSHSMGSIAFAPDGALLASGGEGGSWQYVDYGQAGNPGGDPPVAAGVNQVPPNAEGGSLRAQDLRTAGDPVGLSGTIIRVNPSTGAALPDNPLFSNPDPNAKRIVAYGLRNPFRITVRPGTREVWIGDVGWQIYDEIDRIPDPAATTVLNFGWPCYEGRSKQPGWDDANMTMCENLYVETNAVTLPYFQYREGVAVVSGEACGIVDSALSGLAFYQGGSYPEQYDGALFFTDYTRNCIWVMPKGANGDPDPAARKTFLTNAASPVDLQIGPGGDLFYVDIAGGTIHRITYSAVPVASATASPRSGSAPLTVNFDGSGSTDPGGQPLTYDWDLDGNGAYGDSNVVKPVRTYSTDGTFTVRLKVTNPAGLSSVASVVITVGNRAPTAIVDSPASTLTWAVGQAITFSGHATDPEEGTLPASALKWSLIMHHCSTPSSCHEHFIQNYTGVAGGTFSAPDHEYPSYLELRLTATDSGGLANIASVRLDPRTVVQTFASNPSGLRIALGTETLVTPATRTLIVGSTSSMSAPSPQTIGTTTYTFASWSDGGGQTHNVVAGSTPATYTATFTGGSGPPDIVRYASHATVRSGTWRLATDASAAGGARMEHPDASKPKVLAALAAPADYFEVTVTADAGRPYRLWLRGRAQNDAYTNDSVHVQFSGSVTSAGAAVNRIGTTSAEAVVVEDCSGCGLSGWGWQDNAYGVNALGPLIYFATSGTQTIRIQGREDGISIDQIALSPSRYLTAAPGATKNDTLILPESPAPSGTIVRYGGDAAPHGTWRRVTDTTAAGGARMEHPDAGKPKVLAPLAAPTDYFEVTVTADAGRPYRLWLRGRAQNDAYTNDSVYVQFSGSVTSTGAAVNRIGTTSAEAVVVEDCNGCGLSGWGWQDNAYGVNALGPLIYFATSGPQTIRIQGREDGISIDQIVLSSDTYVTARPGATKNDTVILPRTP